MAIPSGVTVGQIQESVRFDNYGHALRVKIISYMVGQDGPFTLEVLPENDTTSYVEGKLAEQAAKIAALRGGAA